MFFLTNLMEFEKMIIAQRDNFPAFCESEVPLHVHKSSYSPLCASHAVTFEINLNIILVCVQ
jgi:hypothetical protein